MTDTYKGQPDDRTYPGEDIDITYNVKRCIHAAKCVEHASKVFDPDARPWIQADNDEADHIADVILRCPSGALHFTRKDGGTAETAPDENRILLWENGPVQIHGDMHITAAGVDIPDETRVTLCRCGASESKPFCDNSHKNITFETDDIAPKTDVVQDATGGKLTITALPQGPVQVEGNFRIEDRAGNVLHAGEKTFLCRCGGSSSKPFCDGTHSDIGFDAE